MYLFVFFWSAAIQSVRNSLNANVTFPFGIAFSCYMCSMMCGSILFTLVTSSHDLKSTKYILMLVLTGASMCFLSAVLLRDEILVFWSFCLFEAFVGAYFPSIGYLKGRVVEDGIRGKVYGILRLPLSIFVIVAHSLAEEGTSGPRCWKWILLTCATGDQHRNNVFLTCSGLLLTVFLVVQKYLGE